MSSIFLKEYINSMSSPSSHYLDEFEKIVEYISDSDYDHILNELRFEIINENGITIDQKVVLLTTIEEAFKGIKNRINKIDQSIHSRIDIFDKGMSQRMDTFDKFGRNMKKGVYVAGVGAGVVAVAAIADLIIRRAKKAYREKKYGVCSKYKHKELAICRLNIIDTYIGVIKSQMSKCNKTTDPKDCKAKLQASIDSFEEDRNKWRERLYEYQTKKPKRKK